MKTDVLGIPGDPGAMQPAEWQKALEATDADFNHLIDGRAMSQFQNVETRGGSVSFVDPNGRLDWEVVNQHRDESTGYWILGHWSI